MTKTIKVDGKDVPIIEPTEIITTYKNAKTGEIYKDEEAYKAANLSKDEGRIDVKVIMPPLDLLGEKG